SAPGVRRGRWARVPDLRRRPGRNGDLGSAREDRGEGRSVRQVDLRHPARRGRRPGGGGATGGAGGRPPAPSGVSFSYAGGAGALHCYEAQLKVGTRKSERGTGARPGVPRSPFRARRGVMALLESIRGPEDIRRLGRDQLQPLADEVRRRLIDVVSQTGG